MLFIWCALELSHRKRLLDMTLPLVSTALPIRKHDSQVLFSAKIILRGITTTVLNSLPSRVLGARQYMPEGDARTNVMSGGSRSCSSLQLAPRLTACAWTLVPRQHNLLPDRSKSRALQGVQYCPDSCGRERPTKAQLGQPFHPASPIC